MVKLKNCSIEELYCISQNKRVYGFGVSKRLRLHHILRSPDYKLTDMLYRLVDNDSAKWGSVYKEDEHEIPVISPDTMCREICRTDVLLIISASYDEIVKQLDAYLTLSGVECYILNFIDAYFDSSIDMDEYHVWQNEEYLIPPVIHYCWFGDKELPEQYKKYIASWKEKCPNYKIIRWDETNYDIHKHPFMENAYERKKWAFVSDYARLDILYEYGGIYLDTDVEVIKNLNDLRKFHAFVGYESTQMVNTGLGIGAEREHEIIKILRDEYDKVDIGDSFELIPCTVYQTRVLRMKGLRCNNSFQILQNGRFAVLPTEFMCGIRLGIGERQITEHTYSLHHYSGDWGGKRQNKSEKNIRILLERMRSNF